MDQSKQMDNELADINAFVGSIPPFDQLPDSKRLELVKCINIIYLNKHKPLSDEGHLYLVRKGALSCHHATEGLLGKFAEGDVCALFYQKSEDADGIKVQTDEDTLLYAIAINELERFADDYPGVSNFFAQSGAQRLNQQMNSVQQQAVLASSLSNRPISELYHSPIRTISASDSIQAAAIAMSEHNHSCLVVVDADKPVGIVTDKDIRRRCVAQGLSISAPVKEIMSADMHTIEHSAHAYDALMKMMQHHIHHLPVLNNGELIAMISHTDLMNNDSQNAVNLSHLIRKAHSVNELARLSPLITQLQLRMTQLGSTAEHVGKSISAISSALTIRLIELAQIELGEAPCKFAWVAAGSQARQEQFAHSDQDNALIIANEASEQDMVWFAKLATFVCDALNQCGFEYCPGEIMASNETWRQTQKVWQGYFNDWLNKPSPQALLNCTVFFDMRCIYGDAHLLEEINHQLLMRTKQNTLFLAHLSKNALLNRPPLGFFRDFVLVKDGQNEKVLDLKLNGLAPIVDLARIYALAEGISATHTIERLQKVAGRASLTVESAKSLIDAYQFLAQLRLEHQSKKLRANLAPDNYLAPQDLSKLEREHLKDAFKVIKLLQDARQSSY